ncbi:MAG TPA: hypothetical protein VMS21_13265 [Methylomirabilota bacterium]|nr:hypothetical protein [Methylomirabilota bacterium]
MRGWKSQVTAGRWAVVALLLFCLAAGVEARAGDIQVDIQLIWGTDEKPDANAPGAEGAPEEGKEGGGIGELKPVDPALSSSLKKIFKWREYYLIKREVVAVASRQSVRVRLSEHCEVVVRELAGERVEVKLFGRGKLVNRTVKSLEPGQIITIAGDDKNETAWFVVIQRVKLVV